MENNNNNNNNVGSEVKKRAGFVSKVGKVSKWSTSTAVLGQENFANSPYRHIYDRFGFGRKLFTPGLEIFNMLAWLTLFGFFMWNLVVISTKFVEDTNNPSLSVKSSVADDGTPNFPAALICNSRSNTETVLLLISYKTSPTNSSFCESNFTSPSTMECQPNFPVPSRYVVFPVALFYETGDYQTCFFLNTSSVKGYVDYVQCEELVFFL